MILVQCSNPSCDNEFSVNEIRHPGGLNDKGGIIVKCKKCGASTPISLKNPDEINGVNGGVIEDRWDE